MTFAVAAENFINASRFAVIGRVMKDPSRFDNKVLRWYQNHTLPVTPIIPESVQTDVKEVEGLTLLTNPLELPDLANTSISIIINPALGLPILQSLFSGGSKTSPRGVWFQPGADSPEIASYVKEKGLEGKVIFGGPCILVSGEELLQKRQRQGQERAVL